MATPAILSVVLAGQASVLWMVPWLAWQSALLRDTPVGD